MDKKLTKPETQERCFAFQDLSNLNPGWRDILHLGRRLTYMKGKTVAMGESLYFLDKGKIRLSHMSLQGVEKILWYLHEGCVFGETPIFDHVPPAGSFYASSDCVVYSFSNDVVERIAKMRPDLMLELFHSMARKMRCLSEQASSLFIDSLKVRTIRFLAQHIVPGTRPIKVDLGITKQEMATFLGVHRISLYKILKDYEERGVLSAFSGNQVTILDEEAFFQGFSAVSVDDKGKMMG
ncbi:MAG: Crp/Fnr family transcriptional regulator [Desulfovibrionaceae bacterium]|nr:Crp/Fnr family transcriptional regulator [Desulfovibrionaceae bacterium]